MEMSRQLHAPAAVPVVKEPSVSTRQKTKWAPEPDTVSTADAIQRSNEMKGWLHVTNWNVSGGKFQGVILAFTFIYPWLITGLYNLTTLYTDKVDLGTKCGNLHLRQSLRELNIVIPLTWMKIFARRYRLQMHSEFSKLCRLSREVFGDMLTGVNGF
jgi:hypothetical protein